MSELVYQALLSRVGEATPRPRIEPTRRLVDLLGNPQSAAPVIQLTGTNGKTSTARMIDALLRASGLRTGLLTSPHLEHFSERIVIDGEPISDEALEANWEDIEPFVAMVDAELESADDLPLTFFEVLTALAFACFADAPVDVMVIEVGMGGEWDSTNVAEAAVAVFTPVDLDHVGRIGNTLREIAETKAGIIKSRSIVVSAAQPHEVNEVLEDRAERLGTELYSAPSGFALEDHQLAVGGQLLSIRGIAGSYPEVFLPLFGQHQGQNAALAVAAVEAFVGGGTVALAAETVSDGLAAVSSPGRLEIVGVSPSVVVDGAHNPHGVRSLVAALGESFNFDELVIVLGVLAEKDARGILRELAELRAPIIVTQSQSDRAVSAQALRDLAEAEGLSVSMVPEAELAIESAREWAGAAPGRGVVVTGSLTLVGQAKTLAEQEGWMRP